RVAECVGLNTPRMISSWTRPAPKQGGSSRNSRTPRPAMSWTLAPDWAGLPRVFSAKSVRSNTGGLMLSDSGSGGARITSSDVTVESINPGGYVDYECTGPLTVVRYEREVLFSIFARHGLSVDEFAYHGGTHCQQSEIFLRKK